MMADLQLSNPAATRTPISLVIPVRNETKSLPALVESIRKQTYAPAEIIIVDGGSDDGTAALARRLTAGDARFRLIEVGAPATPGKNRNLGFAAAAHEWVALTDAGIHLEPSWLEQLVRVVEDDPQVDVVYGNYEPIVNTLFESCAALSYPAPKQLRPGGPMRGPFIASSLLRRAVWEEVGGFPDWRAAEDLEFMEAIERRHFKIAWAPRATVWWQLRPSLMTTFRKFVLYSRHNVWAGRQHDWHYGIMRQYLVWIACGCLALVTRNPWWLMLIPLGFAARAALSIWRRREKQSVFRAFHPVRFLGVVLVLLTIDLATFVGWAQALRRHQSLQPAGEKTVTSGP